MSTSQTPVAAYPKVRRIRFHFDEPESSDKHFIRGDMVFSHFVAGLSAGFPAGEEGFIRSVRRFSDQITDPVLKKRVAAFIGQEAVHGQEHRRLNERLVELDYPTVGWMDSEQHRERMIRLEQRLPDMWHLALTAAAEHYTAVLAERALDSEEIQSIPGEPEIWHLLNWHMMEELEHKSVAFDVFRAVGGSESTRIGVMLALYLLTLPATVVVVLASLAHDPVARRQPAKVARQAYKLLRGPIFRGLLRDLAVYMKPGFHPDHIDTAALLERWQRELFGDTGVLVDHLK
ncbi:metal-dependent hydrolase [Nocardia uniformis]|uniref:Metal-dependent hydrolase n=1 Tax=Nocardia uniformis TaxID=53432 RepID=A0A849CA13_9NOCA|nr:metal-dependent hydrolase [Nocardia uniformis]NNH72767.1 metal-dependent hydrolase [Nocardia uniformis]